MAAGLSPRQEKRGGRPGVRTAEDPARGSRAAAGIGDAAQSRWLQCVCKSLGVEARTATTRSSSLKNQVRRRVIGVGGGGNASAPQSDKALSS